MPTTGREKLGSFEPTSVVGVSGLVVGFCVVVVVVVVMGAGVVGNGAVCLFLLVATTAATMKIITSKTEIAVR